MKFTGAWCNGLGKTHGLCQLKSDSKAQAFDLLVPAPEFYPQRQYNPSVTYLLHFLVFSPAHSNPVLVLQRLFSSSWESAECMVTQAYNILHNFLQQLSSTSGNYKLKKD